MTEKDYLQTLIDTIIDAVITADEHGLITTFSVGAEKMFGYSADEIRGKNLSILMPEPYASKHDEYMQRYVQTGEKHIIGIGREALAKRKNGETFPVDLAVNEFFVDDVHVFLGLIRDITQRKEAEKQVRILQKFEIASTMAAGIAHDFRNILTPVLSYAELALADTQSEDLRHHLEEIKKGALHAKDLVQNLLSFGRPMDTEQKEEVSLEDIITKVVDLLSPTIPKNIQLRPSIDPNCPHIQANPTQIEQVIINLCTNAADAMKDRGGIVDIKLHTEESLLQLTVEDTGAGIDHQTLDHIFDPYFTTKPKGKGTGLGLFVTQKITHDLGGKIQVTSEIGKGTAFIITIPVAIDTQEIARGNESLLLVLEDSDAATSIKDLISSLGYQVNLVHNLQEATDRIKASSYSMVIADEEIANLPKTLRDFSSIPIILLGHAEHIVPEGVTAVVEKPVQIKELSHSIRMALQLRV